MASLSAPRRGQELRSGGKMVRARRTVTPRTPYDGPRLVDSEEQNPNWISRLVLSPTRMIASSAGKLINTVFGSDSSDSSSSSSSISDSDAFPDELDNNEVENYVSSQGAEDIEKREPQNIVGPSETKWLIEQLLMRETFSRQECDRLTNIIKSRVVDSSLVGFMETGGATQTPKRTTDDVVDTAVMEARKWLEEKKSGSSPKLDLHYGTGALSSAIVLLGSDGEAGSPVDMAKSYMRTRPPWASPSGNHIEYRSPSPIPIHVCKEGQPYSISESSPSSSKLKRDSPTTSPWSIRDELRKVRSKATEEMLRTTRSSTINLLENKSMHDATVDERSQSIQENYIPSSTKSLYASLNLAAETGDTLGMGNVINSAQDVKNVSDSDAGAADVNKLKETNGASHQLNSTDRETIQAVEIDGGVAMSGSRSSVISLAHLPDGENHKPRGSETNAASSGHGKNTYAHGEMTCELLSEATVEVPILDDSVATGPAIVSSLHYEDSSQDPNRPDSKRRKTSRRGKGRAR